MVADEVQAEQLRPLRDSVGRGSGRIRLITVGHSSTPDPVRIPALLVKPLDAVDGQGHQRVVPRNATRTHGLRGEVCGGYVRLALLAAYAVALSPTMDVRELLGRNEIRSFLDGMLGAGDRRALYVLAVLTSVGWTDDVKSEGEAVAKHLGLNWNSVRADVEGFHRRFGIAPRGGRYRYISVYPLAFTLPSKRGPPIPIF